MIKHLLGLMSIMLMLTGFSRAAIVVENDASKLVIDGFLSMYADTGHQVADIGKTFTVRNNVSRINFGFSHKESESLTSVGYLSIGIDPLAEYGSSSQFLQKYRSYVGLEHKTWGNLYLGTVTSPNYQVLGWTDIGNGFTGDSNSAWDNGDRGAKIGTGYAEDAIFYGNNFAFTENQSIDIYVQAQAAENTVDENYDGGSFGEYLRRRDAYSAGVVYNISKFSVGIAGVTGSYEIDADGKTTTISELSGGMRWNGEKLYLAIAASIQQNVTALDIEDAGVEIAADYKIGGGYGLMAIYNLRRITGGDMAGTNKDKNDIHYINLMAYRNLSANIQTFVMFKFDLRSDTERDLFLTDFADHTSQTSLAAGFTYYF